MSGPTDWRATNCKLAGPWPKATTPPAPGGPGPKPDRLGPFEVGIRIGIRILPDIKVFDGAAVGAAAAAVAAVAAALAAGWCSWPEGFRPLYANVVVSFATHTLMYRWPRHTGPLWLFYTAGAVTQKFNLATT